MEDFNGKALLHEAAEANDKIGDIGLDPVLISKYIRNHSFFSRLHLQRFPTGCRMEWRNFEKDQINFEEIFLKVSKSMKEIEQEIEDYNPDERIIEMKFIFIVLESLGHHILPQAKLRKSTRKIMAVDGALYYSEQNFEKAKKYKKEGKFEKIWELTRVLLESKNWSVNLDGDMEQVHRYLYYSRVKYAIYTNGRIWRLCSEKQRNFDLFFEMDLEKIIKHKDLEGFKLFFKFFCAKSFETDSFIDKLYDAKEKYTTDLEKNISFQIKNALETLAQGYLRQMDAHISWEDENYRELLHQQCTHILCRALFLLFGEAPRFGISLMPMNDVEYKRHSLTSLIDKIIEGKTQQYYSMFATLCHMIEEDSMKYTIANRFFRYWNNLELFKHVTLLDHDFKDFLTKLAISITQEPYMAYDFSTISIEHIGNIYDLVFGYILQYNKSKKKIICERSDKRQQEGTVFTPSILVKGIVEATLQTLSKPLDQYSSNEILELRVLDPAMGTGHFLISTGDYLASKYLEKGLKEGNSLTSRDARQLVAKHCLYGVEKNEESVQLAQLALYLWGFRDVEDINPNLICGDALASAVTIEERGKTRLLAKLSFHWCDSFNQILSKGGFDIIVTNPPYVEISRYADKPEFEIWKTLFASMNWQFMRYGNTYFLFMERIIMLLRENGVAGVIIPINFLETRTSSNITHEKLVESCEINAIFDISTCKPFPDIRTCPMVVIFTKKQDHLKEYPIIVEKWEKENHEYQRKSCWTNNFSGDLTQVMVKSVRSKSREIQLTKFGESKLASFSYHTSNTAANRRAHQRAYLNGEYDGSINENKIGKFVIASTVQEYSSLWGKHTTKINKYSEEEDIKDIKVKGSKIIERKYILKPYLTIEEINNNQMWKKIPCMKAPKLIFPNLVPDIRCFFDLVGNYLAPSLACAFIDDDCQSWIPYYLTGAINSQSFRKKFKETNFKSAAPSGNFNITPKILESLYFPFLINKKSELNNIAIDHIQSQLKKNVTVDEFVASSTSRWGKKSLFLIVSETTKMIMKQLDSAVNDTNHSINVSSCIYITIQAP